MKTKEFIRKVEDSGYRVVENDDVISIHYLGENIGNVFKNKECKNPILLDLMVEYTNTPIEEREEPKKYHLKHRWMTTMGGFPKGLRINIATGTADVEQMIPMIGYQNQFTKKEIEEIKERFDTDLADFKEVEVE